MSKQPRRIYLEKRDARKKRTYRLEVGVAWPTNKSGDFYIDIPLGISVTGRLFCPMPKAAEKKATDPDGGASFWLSDN